MSGAAILTLRHHRGFGGGVVATVRSAPPCPLAAAAPEDEPARPLIDSSGRGRWPGAACAAPPGRFAPRGRGGGCTPAPAARAAPRGDAPGRRTRRLTLPPPTPIPGQAVCVRRPGTPPRELPSPPSPDRPAPTPARSSSGPRTLDGRGLRCGDSPDREGPGFSGSPIGTSLRSSRLPCHCEGPQGPKQSLTPRLAFRRGHPPARTLPRGIATAVASGSRLAMTWRGREGRPWRWL